MKNLFFAAWIITVMTSSVAQSQPVIEIIEVFNIDGQGNHAVDVFYTPTDGDADNFGIWRLKVTPSVGSLLDPEPLNTTDDVTNGSGNGPAIDTWANVVNSSVDAGTAGINFASYDPKAADPIPSANGDIDQLFWIMFDFMKCDGECAFVDDFAPFHMARVMYEAGGGGKILAEFFEGSDAVPDAIATATYGVPEPSTVMLASLALMTTMVRRRRS